MNAYSSCAADAAPMQGMALVVHKKGPWRESIVLERDWPMPMNPAVGHVTVRVVAAGLAFPDLLTAEDKHVHPLGKLPRTMGRELAGVVVKVGLGVTQLKLGDWVFGSSVTGAWASYAMVAEQEVHKFTPSASLHPRVVAGFAMNYGTSWHALVHQAAVKAGDVVLILGAAGGIGLAAIDIAKALGATVIACGSSMAKLETCRQAGADYLVDYTDPDKMRTEVEKITQGKAAVNLSEPGGVDVVFDAVGGQWSERGLRLLRFGGRFLVLGFASGSSTPKDAIPRVPLNLVLLNERKVLGVLYGTWKKNNPAADRAAIETMLALMEKGILRPLVKAFPLEQFKVAAEDLMNRRSVGKLVFEIAPSGGRKSLL
jgi:NADPH2:quinone reductase